MGRPQTTHTTLGILLEFWESSDFPRVINLGRFRLQRLHEGQLQSILNELGDELSSEDKERWRTSRYALVHDYVPASPRNDEESADVAEFHRFVQTLRILRSSPVVGDVINYRRDGRGSISNIRHHKAVTKRTFPAKLELSTATFSKSDALKMKRYHALYELVAQQSGYDRLATAFYFFEKFFHEDQARLKVIAIVTSMEALFNTGAGESTFKLALRCACILENEPSKRYETFEVLSKIYDLRSKIVHGQSLGNRIYNDASTGTSLIIQAENLVRRCLQQILKNNYIDLFSKGEKELTELFNKFVIGVNKSPKG